MYRCSKRAWSNLPRHVRKAYYCLLEQRQYYINPSVWNRHQNHYFQWKRRRNCDNRRALKTWIEVILVTFCESFHCRQLERSIQSILLSCHQSIIKKKILKDFLAKNFFSSFIKSVQVKKRNNIDLKIYTTYQGIICSSSIINIHFSSTFHWFWSIINFPSNVLIFCVMS